MRVSEQVAKDIASRAASDILDAGLGKSTFRDNYPDAYNELLRYREDIMLSVKNTIQNKPR